MRRADTRFAPARADLPRRAPIEMEIACPVCEVPPFVACTPEPHCSRVTQALLDEFVPAWTAAAARVLGGAA